MQNARSREEIMRNHNISSRHKGTLELGSIQGQVIRVQGTVDRFGAYVDAEGHRRTICIKDLQSEKTNQPLGPDHVWLPVRAELAALGLQPGDRVAFTFKVQRQHKDAPGGRRITYGPGRAIQDLVILQRRKLLAAPRDRAMLELQQMQGQLAIAEQEKGNLSQAVQSLDGEIDSLKSMLSGQQTQVQQLHGTVGQLEQQLQAAMPKQRAFTWISVCTIIALTAGLGLGVTVSRSASR
jgi:hypothetical protein